MTEHRETVEVPYLDRLPPGGAELIHEKSLTILEEFGIQMDHPEVQDVLEAAGCRIDREEDLVYVPGSLAEDSMQSAPSSFTVRGRGAQPDKTVGGDEPVISTAAGSPYMYTFEEGRRSSTMADFELFQKLVQMADVIDTEGHDIVAPNDYDESIAFLEAQLRSLTLTDKIPKGNCYGEDRARMVADMVGIVHDDPDLSDYYLVGNANSVSPRTWDTKMIGGVMQHARMEQPIILAPAAMASASAPGTIAGTMALVNAEILAGATLTQVVNEGTPLVYGLPTSNTDIRYGTFSIGSPEGALFISLAGEMARFYDVPSRAGGGLNDAKTVDEQAGSEAMFQLTASMFSGIDFISHGAGLLDTMSTSSPEKFVLDLERIRYIKRYEDGFELTDEKFALDLIEEVEPAGHFLNQQHTLTHATEEFMIPELAVRNSHGDWKSAGSKTAFERAHEHVQEILDSYERPAMDEDIQQDLERYVAEKRSQIIEA